MRLRERARNYATEKIISEIMALMAESSTKNIVRMITLGEKLTHDPEYKQSTANLDELFEQDHPSSILVKDVTMSGGEVFTRKDIFDIWEKHTSRCAPILLCTPSA